MKHNYAVTKNNRIIEFPDFSVQYLKFLMLRVFAFAIDYIIVLALQIILYVVTKFEWWMVGMAGIVWMVVYSMLMYLAFGRTLGLIATRTYATHHTGFLTSNKELFFRAILMSIFTFPLIGWALMIATTLTTPFWKGITLVDFISRTTILTRKTYKYLQELESKVEEDSLIYKGVYNE